MKITYQINRNECGLCVISSLINYFYNKKIKLDELLNEVKLTNNGINLYDFELVGEKYGLQIDSYECNYEEFLEFNYDKYFVLLLNFDNNMHYVIAKKQKNKIRIFCSENGEYELSYEELKHHWTNIYIEVNKIKNFSLEKTKTICRSNIDWKSLFFTNLIQILVLLLTIFNSTFFDQLFDKIISNQEMSNLLFLIVIFSLTFFTKYIGNIFINLYCYKKCFSTYKYYQNKMINKLNNKYLSFYKKIDENFIRNANNICFDIVAFYNIYLNDFIANALLIIGINIYIFILNKIMFIIFLSYILSIVLIELVNYLYYKKQVVVFENTNNKFNNIWNLLVFKINKINYIKFQNELTFNFKSEQINFRNILYKNLNFNTISNLIGFLSQHIFFVLIIVFNCQFIVNDHLFNFSKLIIIMNMFQLIENSSKSIIGIINKINQLKYNQQIFNNLLNVDNKLTRIGINEINDLETIIFNNLTITNDSIIFGKSGCGKTTLLYKINNLVKLSETDKIFFNDLNVNNISNLFFSNNMIYLNSKSEIINENEIVEIINNSQYKNQLIDVLKILNIKDFKNCSLGQKQIILFLSLLNYKNKIICLDEQLSNVDIDTKILLFEKIKPLIIKNNFLVYVSHDKRINKYFRKEINFDQETN